MNAPGHLVMRHGHLLWAVTNLEVQKVRREEKSFVIELHESRLRADEVLGIFDGLVVRPQGTVLPRFWPTSFAGCAVLGDQPVVIVDPLTPPAELLENQAD